MKKELDKVQAKIDTEFDKILGQLDKALEELNSLGDDVDMVQWLADHPEFDPKNLNTLAQGVQDINWTEDFSSGEDILKEIGRLGDIASDDPIKQMEDQFAEQMIKLDKFAENFDSIITEL